MPDEENMMMTFRLARTSAKALDERAAALGMTRSDLLRVLIALPVALDVASSKGARTASDDIDGAADKAVSEADSVPQTAPADAGEVLLLTDKPLRDIRIAIDRWGQNYNQSVRALNRLMRRFGYRRHLTEEEFGELLECLRACARSNEKASAGIKQVHEDMKELVGRDRYDMRSAVAGQERRTRRTGAEDYAARAMRASNAQRSAPGNTASTAQDPAADASRDAPSPPLDDPAKQPARRKRKRNRRRNGDA